MKLSHIKLKPTVRTLAELNNDAPYNGELFAELMHHLYRIVKGDTTVALWANKKTTIEMIKAQIRALLEGK